MSELRWEPIKREWIVTATHRMDRTFLPPPEYCPLCPTTPGGFPTEIPRDDFEIVVFENKFPSFKLPPAEPEVDSLPEHPVLPAKGVCEVVVYTSEHQGGLATLSRSQILNLVRVWRDRYEELGQKQEVEYVLIFENRGEEVGVTLHHPHGQIYAFPYVPPVPAREFQAARAHQEETGQCLFCSVVETEAREQVRVIHANDSFVAFVPFAARYAFEVHLYAKRHCLSLAHLTNAEESDLAEMLQTIIRSFDYLFERPFPYIMVVHQEPVNNGAGLGHLHFEFYPPLRDQGKLKFLAGCEQGAGTFINDSLPEAKAQQLRDALAQTFK